MGGNGAIAGAAALGIDVARVERDLAGGWSLPTRWYWDRDHYRFEQAAIFGRRWQYVAPIEKLRNPGDCVVGEAGEVPVVVTRARDGKLRGFVNVCRHRGYAVCERDQNCRALVCRYHAWAYNLDGTLRAAPGSAEEPGFDAAELSLVPVAVDAWGPAVLVNPDANAAPFLETHPKFAGMTAERGVDPDPARYRLSHEITYDVATNWKLWYDNHVECYHCPNIHPGSFGEAFNVDPARTFSALIDSFTTYSFEPTAAPETGNALRSRSYRSFQVFPGFTIIQQDDIMLMSQMIPTGPETTRYVLHIFTEDGADEGRVAQWVEIWDRTFREDAEATEVQHRGLRAGRVSHSRFLKSQERPLVFINQLTWAAYKEGLGVA